MGLLAVARRPDGRDLHPNNAARATVKLRMNFMAEFGCLDNSIVKVAEEDRPRNDQGLQKTRLARDAVKKVRSVLLRHEVKVGILADLFKAQFGGQGDRGCIALISRPERYQNIGQTAIDIGKPLLRYSGSKVSIEISCRMISLPGWPNRSVSMRSMENPDGTSPQAWTARYFSG